MSYFMRMFDGLVLLFIGVAVFGIVLVISQDFRSLATGFCSGGSADQQVVLNRVPLGMAMTLTVAPDSIMTGSFASTVGSCNSSSSAQAVFGSAANVDGVEVNSVSYRYTGTYLSGTPFGGLSRLIIDLLPVFFIIALVMGAVNVFGRLRMGGG